MMRLSRNYQVFFSIAIFVCASVVACCANDKAAADWKVEADKGLKAFHQGISKYLEKNDGVWPQMSLDLDREGETKAWQELLNQQGVDGSGLLIGEREDGGVYYTTTPFDSTSFKAYQFRGQPWVIAFWGNEVRLISCDGEPYDPKPLEQLKPLGNGKYIDPERTGSCDVSKVPEGLRSKYAEVKAQWKDEHKE